MKTIERFVRRETPVRKHSFDEPVEGELVRRKGRVYKVDMNAEELSALRELPVISGMYHAHSTNTATDALFFSIRRKLGFWNPNLRALRCKL